MKKETAKLILALPTELVIKYYEESEIEDIRKAWKDLCKTRSKERIVQILKKIAKDVLLERATVLNVDGKQVVEYHGVD